MTLSLNYIEAIVVGAFQGVTELFPVSSLGHSILVPALVGGQWAQDLSMTAEKSPYLAFLVAVHVATAVALLVFFWRDWVAVAGGLVTSIKNRKITTSAERLAWLLILATIPVGIAGLALDHALRTSLGKPIPAAAFLAINGVVLFVGERLRHRTASAVPAAAHSENLNDSDERLARLPIPEAMGIGAAQILALLPGISRSGATMVAGVLRGLSHEDAARFSFLLATPVILAAGALKIPELFGPAGDGIGGQVLAGSAAAFVAAYLSVRFLVKYFETRTLTPFAIYCVVAGLGSLAWLTLH
ncbi:undecaprenyl-diphosphatase [Mycolicibacterium mucogenicum]|uniref:Undecaprenyl-diphosphatase n=1 Tax=Mycolicibacterium mucogenicum TaxID=56689 RepID=A0A1A3H674_MYCMU|nr:undecaprenyl-diphosphate phosphatase [Mycolicibacterium mucogenicum]OBJ43535.1 undecaprenyl-diphosphatase [Mycolicibacterium mucogenicum]